MSPIPLGILAASGVGVAAPVDAYDFLVAGNLSTNEASVTFNNLTTTYGGDYRHLQIRGVSKTTRNNDSDNLKIIVNGLGGTSYAWHTMYGTSANISHYSSSSTSAALGPGIPGEVNLYKFGAFVIDILDFAQTDKNTVIRYMGGHPQAGHGIASVLVNSNAAVESLQFSSWTGGTNLRAGTRFSVYGIRG